MTEYRHKPFKIYAYRWDGKSVEGKLGMPDWLYTALNSGRAKNQGGNLIIRMGDGQEICARPEQWVFRDQGNTYGVLDDAEFNAKYELPVTRPARLQTWRNRENRRNRTDRDD